VQDQDQDTGSRDQDSKKASTTGKSINLQDLSAKFEDTRLTGNIDF